MNIFTFIAIATLVLAISLAILTASGCGAFRGPENAGGCVDDATITTRVKARVDDSKLTRAANIRVKTLNGAASLSGFAKSAEEKNKADRIARKVPQVLSARDEVLVHS